MDKSVRFRTRLENGSANVKILIFHPMETGYRKDKKTNEIVPKHFIHTVNVFQNNDPVMIIHWSRSVSKNPYLNLKIRDCNLGDLIRVSWEDNFGESGFGEVKLE